VSTADRTAGRIVATAERIAADCRDQIHAACGASWSRIVGGWASHAASEASGWFRLPRPHGDTSLGEQGGSPSGSSMPREQRKSRSPSCRGFAVDELGVVGPIVEPSASGCRVERRGRPGTRRTGASKLPRARRSWWSERRRGRTAGRRSPGVRSRTPSPIASVDDVRTSVDCHRALCQAGLVRIHARLPCYPADRVCHPDMAGSGLSAALQGVEAT
jgi:hypothetical protein